MLTKQIWNTSTIPERHLLYVACTRARDHLLVTGIEPLSEFLGDFRILQEGVGIAEDVRSSQQDVLVSYEERARRLSSRSAHHCIIFTRSPQNSARA